MRAYIIKASMSDWFPMAVLPSPAERQHPGALASFQRVSQELTGLQGQAQSSLGETLQDS